MNCIFCKIANKEISSEEFIYENDNFFSIYDINPALPGHALVISKKHYETILDVPATLGVELMDAIKNTSLKIIEKFQGEGMNVLVNVKKIAGQEVMHFHLHLVPRKKSDNAQLKFIDKDSGKSAELRDKY